MHCINFALGTSNKILIFIKSWLIDHAWTFKKSEARQHLHQISGLLERMSSLMGIGISEEIDAETRGIAVEQVVHSLWRYAGTYKLAGAVLLYLTNTTLMAISILNVSIYQGVESDDESVWYILDEFGSRFEHSFAPSFAFAPIFFGSSAFTLFWPLRDIQAGGMSTYYLVWSMVVKLCYYRSLSMVGAPPAPPFLAPPS